MVRYVPYRDVLRALTNTSALYTGGDLSSHDREHVSPPQGGFWQSRWEMESSPPMAASNIQELELWTTKFVTWGSRPPKPRNMANTKAPRGACLEVFA